MNYCTQADLVTRFGEQELIQLTDRDILGVIDETVLAQAIAEASGEIDGYLRGRYPLPLLATTSELSRIAGDIARYRLYDDQLIDVVEERYKQAVDWLKSVAAGRIVLPDDIIDTTAGQTVSGGISVAAPSPTFTSAVLEQMGL